MKANSKSRGAASVLVVVVIVIVGWTIGMFMQDKPRKKESDAPKTEADANVAPARKADQPSAPSRDDFQKKPKQLPEPTTPSGRDSS